MEKLLDVQDAATLLGIKKITLYIWAEKHILLFYMIGRLIKVSPAQIASWVKKSEVPKKEINAKGLLNRIKVRCNYYEKILAVWVCGN